MNSASLDIKISIVVFKCACSNQFIKETLYYLRCVLRKLLENLTDIISKCYLNIINEYLLAIQ